MPHNIKFLPPEPIRLLDESDDDAYEYERGSQQNYFRVISISVEGYTNIDKPASHGKLTIWDLRAEICSNGTTRMVRLPKRYSDFVRFRERLLLHMPPHMRKTVVQLPPPVSWYDAWRYKEVNFDKEWLRRRRAGLQFFVSHIFLDGDIVRAALPLIQRFLKPAPVGRSAAARTPEPHSRSI